MEEQDIHGYPFTSLPSLSKDSQMVYSYQLYVEDFFSCIGQRDQVIVY